MANYKNYHIMRDARKHLLSNNQLCEECKINPAKITHHKDWSKINHSENNLICLCQKCHMKLHRAHGDIKGRRLKIFYNGKSIKDWSIILGISSAVLYNRFRKYGELSLHSKNIIENGYGRTFQQIASIMDISRQRVHQLHKNGTLKNRIKKFALL